MIQSILSGDSNAYGRLILEQAHKVVGKRPKHPEGRAWQPDDELELAGEFCESSGYQYALVKATSDDQLRGYVYRCILNQVNDVARVQERGRLLRRLKELLKEEEFVEHPAKFWRRRKDPTDASTVVLADLAAATWTVEVALVRWSEEATRNSPFAERPSLVGLLNAVADAADGAVHQDVLVDVVAARLGLSKTPMYVSLEDGPYLEPVTADAATDAVMAAVAAHDEADAAAEIIENLDDAEVLVFPIMDLSAREISKQLGIGKTKANDVQQRLRDKLTVLLPAGEDDRIAVIAALRDRLGRTPQRGEPLEEDAEDQ